MTWDKSVDLLWPEIINNYYSLDRSRRRQLPIGKQKSAKVRHAQCINQSASRKHRTRKEPVSRRSPLSTREPTSKEQKLRLRIRKFASFDLTPIARQHVRRSGDCPARPGPERRDGSNATTGSAWTWLRSNDYATGSRAGRIAGRPGLPGWTGRNSHPPAAGTTGR